MSQGGLLVEPPPPIYTENAAPRAHPHDDWLVLDATSIFKAYQAIKRLASSNGIEHRQLILPNLPARVKEAFLDPQKKSHQQLVNALSNHLRNADATLRVETPYDDAVQVLEVVTGEASVYEYLENPDADARPLLGDFAKYRPNEQQEIVARLQRQGAIDAAMAKELDLIHHERASVRAVARKFQDVPETLTGMSTTECFPVLTKGAPSFETLLEWWQTRPRARDDKAHDAKVRVPKRMMRLFLQNEYGNELSRWIWENEPRYRAQVAAFSLDRQTIDKAVDSGNIKYAEAMLGRQITSEQFERAWRHYDYRFWGMLCVEADLTDAQARRIVASDHDHYLLLRQEYPQAALEYALEARPRACIGLLGLHANRDPRILLAVRELLEHFPKWQLTAFDEGMLERYLAGTAPRCNGCRFGEYILHIKGGGETRYACRWCRESPEPSHDLLPTEYGQLLEEHRIRAGLPDWDELPPDIRHANRPMWLSK